MAASKIRKSLPPPAIFTNREGSDMGTGVYVIGIAVGQNGSATASGEGGLSLPARSTERTL
jgi:hypothetical protein